MSLRCLFGHKYINILNYGFKGIISNFRYQLLFSEYETECVASFYHCTRCGKEYGEITASGYKEHSDNPAALAVRYGCSEEYENAQRDFQCLKSSN